MNCAAARQTGLRLRTGKRRHCMRLLHHTSPDSLPPPPSAPATLIAMARRSSKSVRLLDERYDAGSLKGQFGGMPAEELFRVLQKLEGAHPDELATLQQACLSLDLGSENKDPNQAESTFVKSVRESLEVGDKKLVEQMETAVRSALIQQPSSRKTKKDPVILLRYLYESPREYRKCCNDDDNMFSNFVDRVVYSLIPNSRTGRCNDCRFQRLTEAQDVPELLALVRKMAVTRRFCDEVVSSLLDSIVNRGDTKEPGEAEALFHEARDLLLKGNPADALSRINRSILKSKKESLAYKFGLRAVILKELSHENDSCIDWATAALYGFKRDVFLNLIGHNDMIQSALIDINALCSSTKLHSKSDIIQYHNFPRPIQSGRLLPEATDRVEIKEQLSPEGRRKGCRLYASKKMNAGDVILSEKSFGSVLTRNAIPFRCFNCLIAVSKRFVPCSHCQLVRYCTETCRSQDWDSSHQQLCPLLDILNFFPAGQAIIKLLIQHGIEAVVSKSRKQSDVLKKPLSNDLQSFFAYRTTLSCSPWTRLNFSLTAIFLAKMALKFVHSAGVSEKKLSAVVLEMLLIMHETREALVEDVGKMKKRYGTFVSPVYRMLPICCQPNTLTQQLGDRTAVIAAKKIEVGEEIRIH